jgi:hypothetical protein
MRSSTFLQRKSTNEPHFASRNFLFSWPELKAKFGVVRHPINLLTLIPKKRFYTTKTRSGR